MVKRGLFVAPVLIAFVRTDLGCQRRCVERVRDRHRAGQLRTGRRHRRRHREDQPATDDGARSCSATSSRLGLIFLAVYLVRDAGWISLPALGATIIFTHLGLLVWELKYVAISLAYPGLKPKPSVNGPAGQHNRATRSISAMLALDVSADQRVDPLAGHLPRVQQGRSHRRHRRRDRHRRLPRRPAARIRCRRRRVCATSPRASVDVHRERHRHADDGQGRPAVDAVPAVDRSSSSTSATCPASSRSSRCRRPPRMAIPLFLALTVWVIYNAVGFKHNGHQATSRRHGVAARACRSLMRPLVGVIELLVQHRPATLLPGRPTLRQHARRSHAADHVRVPDQRVVLRRDEAALPDPMAILPFFMLLFLTGVRGAGRPAAGLHLHDPHRRLHRRRSAPIPSTEPCHLATRSPDTNTH